MVGVLDLVALEEKLNSTPPQVHLASIEPASAEVGAEQFGQFLKKLEADAARFLENTAWVQQQVEQVRTADNYFTDEEKASIRRVAVRCRSWAPRFAEFYFPEDDPIAVSFRGWIRPYNDAVRAFVRSLLDAAQTVEARLAADEAEEAEADAWVDGGGLDRLRAEA